MRIKFKTSDKTYDINIYDLDSRESIIQRLASKDNIVPEFLHFPESLYLEDISSLADGQEFFFQNFKSEFIDSDSFLALYNIVIKNNTMTLTEIVYNYIILNKNLYLDSSYDGDTAKMIVDTKLLQIEEDVKKIDPKFELNIQEVWNNRESHLKSLEKKIDDNKIKISKLESEYKEFSKLVGLKYTPFSETFMDFEVFFNGSISLSILDVFNSIILNSQYVFAATYDYFKILKNSTPLLLWEDKLFKTKDLSRRKRVDDNEKYTNIVFKSLTSNYSSKNIEDNYTETRLIRMDDGSYKANFQYYAKNYQMTREQFIDSFLNILNPVFKENIKRIELNKLLGTFQVPDVYLNRYVIEDLALNDPMFSNVLALDDSSIKTKDTIYIYFNSPVTGRVTVSITNQTATDSLYILDKNFKPKSNFLQISITSGKNQEQIKKFQNLFSKFLSLYLSKYNSIIEAYKQLGIDLTPEMTPPQKEQLDTVGRMLQKFDPEVFKPRYTKGCTSPVLPVTTDEQEAELLKQNRQIMTFPREDDDNYTSLTSPKKYYCRYDTHPYPGLQKSIEGSNIGFVPCCFKDDQTSKQGSLYRVYFDEDIEKSKKKIGYVRTSAKIVNNNILGKLPDSLIQLLSFMDLTGTYYRKGVIRSPSSFLSCILKALEKSGSDSSSSLQRIREGKLSDNSVIGSCKQELYDKSLSEIRAYISESNTYLDPKLYIHLLESYYNCNIFIFSTIDSDNSMNIPVLVTPRNSKGYIKEKNRENYILIYEHKGSISENLKYPQCELIIRKNGEEEELFFSHDDNIITEIFSLYSKLNISYYKNLKIEYVPYNLKAEIEASKEYKLISQYIDSNGKCRLITVSKGGTKISLITTPLPPYSVSVLTSIDIYRSDIDFVLDFLSKTRIQVVRVYTSEGKVISLMGIKTGTVFLVPVIHIEVSSIPEKILKIKRIKATFKNQIVSVEKSYLEEFQKYKRLSRCIIEYMYWLYSRFVYDKKIENNYNIVISLENLNKFVKENIRVDSSFEYRQIDQSFSLNSAVMKGGKLVVKSESTLERLIFCLKHYIRTDFSSFLDFRLRKDIKDYYLDVSDFDVYPEQIILKGEDGLRKFVKENEAEDLVIENKIVDFPNYSPYIFKNDIVEEDQLYLTQNTSRILESMDILNTWYTEGYNKGSSAVSGNKAIRSLLYNIKNTEDINIVVVNGEDQEGDYKILGTKINSKPIFSPLIEL